MLNYVFNRIISDHGREARFPYLDEKVTNFLTQLPVHIKVSSCRKTERNLVNFHVYPITVSIVDFIFFLSPD